MDKPLKQITDIIDCLYRVSLKAVVIKNGSLFNEP